MDHQTPARGALTLRTCASLDEVEPEAWDRMVPEGDPFLGWGVLSAFEAAGCARAEHGWLPNHLLYERDGALVGAAPMYIKGHSAGEFVFDHAWADAAYRSGIAYYPKGVVAVPFTPVTGSRLLTAPGVARAELLTRMAGAAWQVADALEVSGLHWLFVRDDEAAALERAGYALRHGIQYHWINRGYETFDDWLSEFKSKRRRTMRRERRELADEGLTVRVLEGAALTPELMREVFGLYLTTIDKKVWGRQYLNARFFELLAERARERLLFIGAWQDAALVAGSIFVHHGGRLYGRYWGSHEEVRFLHFEVCYYKPVELCIERGWQRFEAGAQGEHKYDRGFAPVITTSAHRLRAPRLDAAIRQHLARERAVVVAERVQMLRDSPSRAVQALADEG